MAMVNAQCGQTVRIGFETENKRTQVRFDLSDIMAEFPGGTAVLTVRRPGDEEATVSTSVTMDGTALVWNVTAWECERRGFLYAQVIYAVGDVVAKTKIYRFQVNESLMGEADEPEGWEDWVDELVEAAADTRAAVESYDEMTAAATGLPAGSTPTAVIDRTGENPVLELGIPAGNDGYTPQRGTDYWTEEDQAAMRQDIADDLTAARQAINDEKVLAVGAVETAGTTQVGLVTAEGTAQKAAVVAQGQATIASIPADYTNLSNDVNNLKSAFDELGTPPKLEDSEAENIDLDVSDPSGNVILRLSEGHIKTKKFNSKFPPVKLFGSDAVADLDVSDPSGNIITRFIGGNFKTKNFNSTYIRQLAGKKWAAVGDSITEVNSRTTMRYHDYIANETGITVYNMGSSGTGYRRQQENNRAFYQRIQNVPADSDVVTIFGSFNDLGGGSYTLGTASDSGTTTIGGCINTTIDVLYSVIPSVHLGIATPTPWDADVPGDTDAEDYVKLIMDVCRRRSIPCLDLFHGSNLRPWDSSFLPIAYSKDEGHGVHPDETGHALFAPMFRQFLFSLI